MKKFILKKESLSLRSEDYSISYEKLLNPQQLEAVFHNEGPALVVAGAGTGKTRTLVYRVARLVESGVHPSEILLLTFTRRAANEMLQRASSILDERCKQVRGGTFHFYCSQILHQYAEQIGYQKNFTIVDSSDALEIIQLIRTQLNLHKNKKRFPNKNTLYSIISTSKNKSLDTRVILLDRYPQFAEYEETIEEVAERYEAYKKQNSVMDFDDLLTNTCTLLNNNEEIRHAISKKHRFVMVDEYQDTNKLQAQLAQLFSSVHGNIMGVGDDAQSIYSFRGAEHRNIIEFPALFPETKIIKLEENYRSTPEILNTANELLKQAHFKYDKQLYSKKDTSDLPALVKASTVSEQSRFVTQMVAVLREQGIPLNSCAVLFRNGRDSYDLEVELNRKNIPFTKYGGQKFTEAAHVKDILAHIRVIVNPMDTIAWNRILMLIDGIGPKTAEDLFTWVRSSTNPFDLEKSGVVSKGYLKQIKSLSKLLLELKENEKGISQGLEILVQYYKYFCEKRYDDYPKRIKDLEAFVQLSVNYSSFEKMVKELTLDPINYTSVDTEQKQNEEPPLVLSTIHSAKGLEWEHVFIIQCLDGIIPSAYSVEEEDQLDEELRLLYVATTRAKAMLYYSYPAIAPSVHGDYFTNPSRFIEAIEESSLENWQLVEEESNQLSETKNSYLES
ncbi:MAG: ATP-dependent helicase [Balneola sp.]|nr:MAG: ATP-dependent helicase [Balneola sp.]